MKLKQFLETKRCLNKFVVELERIGCSEKEIDKILDSTDVYIIVDTLRIKDTNNPMLWETIDNDWYRMCEYIKKGEKC